MNVTELARQLKTTQKELLAKLPELGFDIGARAIKIDNMVAERIKEAWGQSLRTERLAGKMREQQERLVADESREAIGKEVALGEKITVAGLAEKFNLGVPHLIGYLMKNGIMASLNQQIDFETASLVAQDYGFTAIHEIESDNDEAKAGEEALRQLKQTLSTDINTVPRPPVVVVMGHVDHGKTTLLDAIRSTNVAGGESGGITQHIGAYQVEEKGRLITFLDTPGHEAFKAMRERGGQVADVAILVVAADDGLKPQTIESINVIQKENLPFVVAINKIDKPGADIDKVKKELAEVNLAAEDWGGKTVCVPVSAKQKLHIAELLDMVLLVADIEKFSANADRDAVGVIIESHIDRGEGPVATVLINAGTLHVGDEVVIGNTFGKIKALKDWRGTNVDIALPSMPVKILGLKAAPRVGDILRVEPTSRNLRKQAKKNFRFIDFKEKTPPPATDSSETATSHEAVSTVPVILKADVLGSLEALLPAVKKLERDGVAINIIKQGLGNITEADIALAESTGAVLYGFNVVLAPDARKMSYRSKASIKTYKVIYDLIADVEARVKEHIKITVIEVLLGELLILKIFKDSRAESILGCRVCKSKVGIPAKFRLLRNNEPIDEGRIIEIQQNKQPVAEVKEGVECGV
ncbi:MAG: translation initiation factor IF-2, partial [Candidatus Komeilibacteria bacterium]|nr:translation initiation factor IF-2 [Candidatus Komeilibacteria bacterium]